MHSQIKIKRTIIHSDYMIMNYTGADGKLSLALADKHSDDQIRLALEPEEVKQLEQIIKTTLGK